MIARRCILRIRFARDPRPAWSYVPKIDAAPLIMADALLSQRLREHCTQTRSSSSINLSQRSLDAALDAVRWFGCQMALTMLVKRTNAGEPYVRRVSNQILPKERRPFASETTNVVIIDQCTIAGRINTPEQLSVAKFGTLRTHSYAELVWTN